MILTYDTTVVDIGRAQYPNPHNTELVQVVEKSASGITYVEDFDVRVDTVTYNFINMSVEEYILLMGFFVNTVNGMQLVFTLTDDRSVDSSVRFTQPKLNFTETYLNLWAGSFIVETVT